MIQQRSGTDGVSLDFAQLPAQVYAGDPLWIPESKEALHQAFSPANPWFRRGHARTFCWPGESRLAAFWDPKVVVAGRSAAFFGYWETRADLSIDQELFGEVEDWARRQGVSDLYGPLNFSVFGDYRLRISAEPGAMTFPGEPYNPPGYAQRLRELGYVASQKYSTWILDPRKWREPLEALRPIREQIGALGYRVETLQPRWWLENLSQVHHCLNAILADYFAYAPLSYQLFARSYGAGFISRACPHSSVVAHGPGGELAGFVILYPHYGPLVVAGAGEGRLQPSELTYDIHLPLLRVQVELPDYIAYFVGVHPEHRQAGTLFATLIAAATERVLPRCRRLLGAMSRASAPSSLFSPGPGAPRRQYAVFHKPIRSPSTDGAWYELGERKEFHHRRYHG